ncbi:hypothetical protein ABZX95_06300 [Streptomyces sp. NPDC004232]
MSNLIFHTPRVVRENEMGNAEGSVERVLTLLDRLDEVLGLREDEEAGQ